MIGQSYVRYLSQELYINEDRYFVQGLQKYVVLN